MKGRQGEHEEMGLLSWGRDRKGMQKKRYLSNGNHYEVREKSVAKEIPRNPQGRPHLKLQAILG